MNILSFLIYCVVATFTPGPTNIVILSSVQHSGAKKSMGYVYGSTLAFGLLLIISTLLNRVLVEIIPNILIIMQVIGSLYMLYLAYKIFKMGSMEDQPDPNANFRSGVLMQLVNPKVLVFTLTVIPNYVMPFYTSSLALFMFVIIITVIGFLHLRHGLFWDNLQNIYEKSSKSSKYRDGTVFSILSHYDIGNPIKSRRLRTWRDLTIKSQQRSCPYPPALLISPIKNIAMRNMHSV